MFGNGDIVDLESANRMFEYTGCDGILIGRGATYSPWIFKSILENKEYVPTLEERFDIIMEHISYIREYETEKNANLKMRKYIASYLKGLKDSASTRCKINEANNLDEVIDILKQYFKKLKGMEDEV